MIHFKLSIFLLLYIDHTHALECALVQGVCTFSLVKSSNSNFYFTPSAENNYAVVRVDFVSSVMPMLTSELCTAFPFLKTLNVNQLSMEILDPIALHKCNSLSYVSFYENNLQELPSNIFDGNLGLTNIILQKNFLKSIDGRIFAPVKLLQNLNLSENILTEQFINFQEWKI